jgi:hypothetical protein
MVLPMTGDDFFRIEGLTWHYPVRRRGLFLSSVAASDDTGLLSRPGCSQLPPAARPAGAPMVLLAGVSSFTRYMVAACLCSLQAGSDHLGSRNELHGFE